MAAAWDLLLGKLPARRPCRKMGAAARQGVGWYARESRLTADSRRPLEFP